MVEEYPQELIDLNSLDPVNVNWFKYIFDKYVKPDSMLNSVDAVVNLLSMILNNQKDEEIQMEVIELIGFDNMEMASELFEKRVYINAHCDKLTEQMKGDSHYGQQKQREVGQTVASLGVTVDHASGSGMNKKKGAGKKRA